MNENVEQTNGNGTSFKDRMAQKSKEASEKVEQARNPPKKFIPLNPEEKRVAIRMMPLLGSDSFKAFQDFEVMCISENLSRAYETPPENWFKSSDFGELMAFKKGLHVGLQLIKLRREELIRRALDEQERESKKGENNG